MNAVMRLTFCHCAWNSIQVYFKKTDFTIPDSSKFLAFFRALGANSGSGGSCFVLVRLKF